MLFLLLRLVPVVGEGLDQLKARPHWWNLWCYLHLLVQERRETAIRAVEREELVYGMALAAHKPAGLADWRRGLREGAGLLQSPETAKERALALVAKLRAHSAQWIPLDQLAPPLQP